MEVAQDRPELEEPEVLQTLPAIGFLADVPDEARRRLAATGMFVSRPAKAFLAIQDRPHHAMALILSGRVSINVYAHGDRIQLAVLQRGDVVGEMCVIDPRVASSTARVVGGPARLWIIERQAFDEFVSADPETGLILMRALGKVLCRRVRAGSELMLRKADEMRAHFLDIDY